jgi:hypothetical protein
MSPEIHEQGRQAPYDFAEAISATQRAAKAQKGAEQARRDAARDLAGKEHAYRLALAKKILEAHADGVAWTVAQDIARGDDRVAQLRYERDVAKGVLDAAEQRAWRHTADRKDMTEFIQWSRMVAPLGQQEEPQHMERPIGAVRAA